jgi:hypothetical protein
VPLIVVTDKVVVLCQLGNVLEWVEVSSNKSDIISLLGLCVEVDENWL